MYDGDTSMIVNLKKNRDHKKQAKKMELSNFFGLLFQVIDIASDVRTK